MKRKTRIERRLNRLKGYDYTQPGYYFVTICTKDRAERFGIIKNDRMVLNQLGNIAKRYLSQIPDHYQNVSLDVAIIMPNHVHCIIEISQFTDIAEDLNAKGINIVGTEQCSVPTMPKTVSLSKIIKSFKDVVTKEIRSNTEIKRFAWQRSFHDRIIQNESILDRIREYIVNNPAQWNKDPENPAKLSAQTTVGTGQYPAPTKPF